jgi:hypothetical protein
MVSNNILCATHPSHTEHRKDELNAFELFTNNSTPCKTKPNKLSRSARYELIVENNIRSSWIFSPFKSAYDILKFPSSPYHRIVREPDYEFNFIFPLNPL